MKWKLIEATNGPRNWGKFCVIRFEDSDYVHRSHVLHGASLLGAVRWEPDETFVLDLQTREGCSFPRGVPPVHTLAKHNVWVCPLYEPFVSWLLLLPADIAIDALPAHIDLPDAPFSQFGYRRGE